ncbi:LmbE family protein [Thermaerobacter marianensis DSM 12885]|uniref:LmbE family protein n=1 Tax=Thermaerobacter marianensis (strain ATCC 700841 / DSM 12885 / JCM 10246 / 7p75a) TaxID=644966 RepID=E6SHB0_THEM7|nr:bacillithiol biosynthesis deacetylase BshB2 [Thermaerobacter marianensis]ADU50674.1 LmbE family protein [Thermaerobacter marianensis DSM 12885]
MEAIEPARVQRALQDFVGNEVYLHLETTHGAYTQGGFGAFARNVKIRLEEAAIRGRGPYRAGLRVAGGWVYAEGLTHWQQEPGRILLEGRDAEDRLTVVLEIGRAPFPIETVAEEAGAQGTVTAAAGEPGLQARGGGAPAPMGRPPAPAAGPSPILPTPSSVEPAAPEAPRSPADLAGGVPAPWDRHLVVVLAHPDDESFGAAGTMALAVHQGIGVTMVCVTAGQMGRRVGRPPIAHRESLGPLRAAELRQAMAAVGVRDVRVLGVWDKTVEFRDRAELARRIRAILEETGATTVITFHPELGGHPDHNAVGAATVDAVTGLGPARPRLLFVKGPARDADPGLPVVTVSIEPVRPLKEAAFRSHRSQTAGWDERLEKDPEMARRFARLFSEESFWVYVPGGATAAGGAGSSGRTA